MTVYAPDNLGFIVKRATPADIPAIREITQEAFLKYQELAGLSGGLDALNETEADIQKDIDEKLVLVAFLEDTPVGSLRIAIDENKVAYLSRFGVRLDFQNQGVGKTLINVADRLMKEKGVKRLQLHTASKIFSLIRFYYGRGFYIDSTTKDRGYIRALLCKDYQ